MGRVEVTLKNVVPLAVVRCSVPHAVHGQLREPEPCGERRPSRVFADGLEGCSVVLEKPSGSKVCFVVEHQGINLDAETFQHAKELLHVPAEFGSSVIVPRTEVRGGRDASLRIDLATGVLGVKIQ